MVGSAIGASLPAAVGIAASPLPVVLVILMLLSGRAASNATAYLVGWFGAVAVVAGFAAVLTGDRDQTDDGGDNGVGVVQLALGVLLLVLALHQWWRRPRAGHPVETPRLFRAVDRLGTAQALGIGVLVVVANPKDLPLAISGGVAMAEAGATGAGLVPVVAVFALVASVTVIVPIILTAALGLRSTRVLARWKEWLIRHNTGVVVTLLVVLGVNAIREGLGW